MYRLALKSLFRRKMRTALSILGIAVGIAMIVCLVSISEGMRIRTLDFSKAVTNSLFVVEEDLEGSPMESELDTAIIEKIEKIPGVEVAGGLVFVMANVKGFRASMSFGGNYVEMIGIEPEKEKMIQFGGNRKIVSGRIFGKDEKKVTVIGKVLAAAIKKKVGDTIEVTVKDAKYSLDITGIYETGSSHEEEGMYIQLDEAQGMVGFASDRINAVDVRPISPERTEEVARKITFLVNGVDANYGKQLVEQLSGFVRNMELTTWIIAGVAAIIGGIGVANTMIMSVMEQTKEIGVLKAVGWYSSDVLKLILLESLMISLLGAAVGALIGASVTFFILPKFLTGFIEPVLTPVLMVNAVGFALLLGLLGGILPARQASRMQPVEAFRGEE